MTQILCKCGQPKESWQDEYQVCHYDMEGNIAWATCPHGIIIIDREAGDE